MIQLPAGFSLPADYYRIYLSNSGATAITDVYGNQLDGEFLGYQNAQGKYVDQLQTGQVRGSGASDLPDLTGDGTPGGAFMTGFVVVPNGGIIYAQAGTIYNSQIPSQTPDGSVAKPYPVLAPEAVPTAANGGNLNSPVNAGTNFNTTYDRSGDGQFEPSAFFAAQQFVQSTGGPVVIIAEASIPARDPSTGAIIQAPFVLQAPSPSGNQAATSANDGSAAVPAMTTLVFDSGTILKMQNAALLIQNQGSALQILGGPNPAQIVNITSYKDSSIGGVSNGNPSSTPSPGDYGGIVFRNFDQGIVAGATAPRTSLFPGQIPVTGIPSVDNRLKGPFAPTPPGGTPTQTDAISGADDIMSYISFLVEKYAGGSVPLTLGVQYDGVTLLNSRPTLVNTMITEAGVAGSAVSGVSVDVDSLRADDVAQGPLLRNDTFINNGINGIYIRAQVSSGVAEATNAIIYPLNPAINGGTANYVLDDPYPYLLTSRMQIGNTLLVETGGTQAPNADRLYVDPGMLVKFELGAGLQILSQNVTTNGVTTTFSASLNVGDQTYIKEFDSNNQIGPTYAATKADGITPNPLAGQTDPNFKANSSLLPQVLFTSFYDDAATTTGTYIDPTTMKPVTIVAALPVVTLPAGTTNPNQPTPTNVPASSRWAGVTIASGSVAVINSTTIQYAGGVINTAPGSAVQEALQINGSAGIGAHVMITNDTFNYNADDPVAMPPDALLAGDPQRPLQSGNPFIHGNIFKGNGYNGVLIEAGGAGPQSRRELGLDRRRLHVHPPEHGRPRTRSQSGRPDSRPPQPRFSPSRRPTSPSPCRAPCPAPSWPTARRSPPPASRCSSNSRGASRTRPRVSTRPRTARTPTRAGPASSSAWITASSPHPATL